jgi:hypothetical protein
MSDNWCPENDGAYQMEMAEKARREKACRIEALEAEVARLRAAMDWQLVDTCPHNAIVLLAWHDRYFGVWRYEVGSASTGSRYENGYSSISHHGSATHWMPLPTAPEGEG